MNQNMATVKGTMEFILSTKIFDKQLCMSLSFDNC